MRVYNLGDSYRVTVSAIEVSKWNMKWPGSGLRGPQSFTFEKRSGDLVDHRGQDGPEALALSHDAQRHGQKKLKLPTT